MRLQAGLLLISVSLLACGTSVVQSHAPAAYSLYVADVDGPPVDLLIGGNVVARLPCNGYTTLIAGTDGVPQLPWSLDVRRQGGDLLKHFEVQGGENFMLLLRGDTIALGGFGSVGPAPASDACAAWSS